MTKNYNQNNPNFYIWGVNLGLYIRESKKNSHRFFKIYSFSSVFPPLCCNLAMPRYGKVLTTNLSCSDSELWLGSLKLLGSGGFLFTETFKALCPGQRRTKSSLNCYRISSSWNCPKLVAMDVKWFRQAFHIGHFSFLTILA